MLDIRCVNHTKGRRWSSITSPTLWTSSHKHSHLFRHRLSCNDQAITLFVHSILPTKTQLTLWVNSGVAVAVFCWLWVYRLMPTHKVSVVAFLPSLFWFVVMLCQVLELGESDSEEITLPQNCSFLSRERKVDQSQQLCCLFFINSTRYITSRARHSCSCSIGLWVVGFLLRALVSYYGHWLTSIREQPQFGLSLLNTQDRLATCF